MRCSWPAMLGTTHAHAHEACFTTGASPHVLAEQTQLTFENMRSRPYAFSFPRHVGGNAAFSKL